MAFKFTIPSISTSTGNNIELLNGLVSYWKLDESSGTRYDAHYTNHLVPTGSVSSANGLISSGSSFNGSTSLSCDSNSSLQTGNIDFTISFWVKFNSLGNNTIVAKAGGVNEWSVSRDPSDGKFWFVYWNTGGPDIVKSTTVPTTGVWYFVVAWCDTAQNKIFIQVNDTTANSLTRVNGGITVNNDQFAIGAYGNGGGFGTDGIIDEVGYWKRILTSGERSYLYNSGLGRSYKFRTKIDVITIDHTKVSGSNLYDFPMLFSGSYGNMRDRKHGGFVTSGHGHDIRFYSDAECRNLLKYHIEYWNGMTGGIVAWINIPTASYTSNTSIYVKYGDHINITDASNMVGVWNSNFKRVFHLNDNYSTSSILDSTGNMNGTYNGANSIDRTNNSKLGLALAFSGSTDYINMNATVFTGSSDYTLSAWINLSGISGNNATVIQHGRGTEAGDGVTIWVRGSDNKLEASVTNAITTVSDTALSINTWYYMTLVGEGTVHKIYLNGIPNGTPVSQSYDVVAGSRNYIGMANYSGLDRDFWSGSLDEVRISNIARSANWIATEYNNQSSPSTFYTVI